MFANENIKKFFVEYYYEILILKLRSLHTQKFLTNTNNNQIIINPNPPL